MIRLRPITFVLGNLLIALAMSMAIPAAADAATGNADWRAFGSAGLFTLVIGTLMVLSTRGQAIQVSLREGFLLTTLSWVAIWIFSALPFLFSNLSIDTADAFFEAISGLTTTGATVLTELESLPPGILLWRALLQWLGGIGIIVMAVTILPFLRVGGMQLFRMESSDRSEKVLPRVRQVTGAIAGVYVFLTLLCALAYGWAGMSPFDAALHAMTTLPTGGFSTWDDSIGHFSTPTIQWIAIFFMIAASLPFVLYIRAWHGSLAHLWRDRQVHGLLGVLICFTLLIATLLWLDGDRGATYLDALRMAAFNVTSVVTTTGFASADYTQWGGVAVFVFFLLTFVGGCTGSTAGGIKIFRFEVLALTTVGMIRGLTEPRGIFPRRYGERVVSDEVALSVMVFFFVFFATIAVVSLLLALFGLDFMTSISGAASAVANVGPGLGNIIGPSGNYASLPDAAKWTLAIAMLLGRLEFFTLLVLCTARFWRG